MSADVHFDSESKRHTFGAGILFVATVLSFASFAEFLWWLSIVCILLADAYAIALIILAALRKPTHLPNRLPALVIIPLLFSTLVFSFAGIDRNCPSVTWQRVTVNGPVVTGTINQLTDPLEALYSSLETITTYGATAVPSSPQANLAVASELLSGAVFLLMILPILIARLADFDGQAPTTKRIVVKKEAGKKWRITRTQESFEEVQSSETKDEMEVTVDTEASDIRLKPPS